MASNSNKEVFEPILALYKWTRMAYFDHLVFGLIWVSPDVMIGYVVLRSKMKVHEV